MKKQSLVLFFSVISLHAVEHDRTVTFKKHNNVNVDIHGFARLDTFFDTRQGMKSPDGSRYIYPLQKDCDDQCCDINDRGSLGFAPGISRLDFSVTGPKINNINLSALLELDFFAYCSTYLGLARLRHAFMKAHGPKASLLVGQFWHPIYPMDCCADTVGIESGAPIEIYARYPQIRFHYYPSSFGLILALYSQFQFANDGPDGISPAYMQNSMTPGLYGAVEIKKENFFMGAGVNMQRIMPELSTTTTTTPTKTYASNAKLTSFIGTVYCSFDINDYIIKNKVCVGQNGEAFLGLGGYAVSCFNTETGQRNFANINFASYWGEISYHRHKKMQPGIFFGVAQNLGSHNKRIYLDEDGNPIFYGWNSELNRVLHISPRIWSNFNNILLGIEFSYTKAWFGKMDHCGKQPCTYSVGNMRALASVMYLF